MKQKFALITGASEGIGRELALCAARDGYSLILLGRSKDKLELLASEIRNVFGSSVEVILADLSDASIWVDLWDRVSDDKSISLLVNCAGLGRNGSFSIGSEAAEMELIKVNVLASTLFFKLAVRDMSIVGHGKILNVASTAAFMPGPGMAVYHATKAFLLSLSRAVSEELRDTNITVITLCPGPTRTRFFEKANMLDSWILRLVPLASAKVVARHGWVALQGRRSRVVIYGWSNRLAVGISLITPSRIMAKVVRLLLERR